MQDLTKEEIRALGHAVGLEIREPELTEVTYSLNALLEALEAVNPADLEHVEPFAHSFAQCLSSLAKGILGKEHLWRRVSSPS